MTTAGLLAALCVKSQIKSESCLPLNWIGQLMMTMRDAAMVVTLREMVMVVTTTEAVTVVTSRSCPPASTVRLSADGTVSVVYEGLSFKQIWWCCV